MKTSQLLCPLILAAISLGLASSAVAQVQTGTVTPEPPAAPKPAATPDGVDIDNIAKIPYESLIKIAQSDASQPADADVYTLRISSKIGVPATQIELYLDRPNSPEKLAVDPNGYFMVPHNGALLKENPKPSEAEVRHYLEGNICRCTGYHNIVKAIMAASGQDVAIAAE